MKAYAASTRIRTDGAYYTPPTFHGHGERWEVEIPSGFETTDPAEVFIPIRGDKTTRVTIACVPVEIDPDAETIIRSDDPDNVTAKPLALTADLALILTANRLLAKACEALTAFAALDEQLAAPGIVVTSKDGTVLAQGDVLRDLGNAMENLDQVCREACDVEWLP